MALYAAGAGRTGQGRPTAARRVCRTRLWKQARSRAAGRAPAAPTGVAQAPLFQGTLYLADIAFESGGTVTRVDPADLRTVQQYLGRVAGPIARYASQYGTCRIAVGNQLPSFTAPITGAEYSDAQLQAWVDSLVRTNGLGASSAVLLINPVGVVNQDAKESGGVGVLGYHGLASVPYCFVNALGSGYTSDDRGDLFGEAVSHEVAEMAVDPRADDSNPEVCDGCGTNCQGSGAYRSYFDAAGTYVGSSPTFPPSFPYAFFLSAIAKPSAATECPAPAAACAYAPP